MDTNQLVSPVIVPKWRPLLACLAWTVSFLGSLCSSQILGQAAISRTFAGRLQWTALASVTFGFCSIFSLHYIALLAQELPVPVHHDPLLTVLSAGIAVLFVRSLARSHCLV
jgi:NO-binding membrane sensor protein with MHYT domain